MNKYLKLLNLTFQEYFIYRTSFFIWQLRNFITVLTILLFWTAVYAGNNEILGYQKNQMLTYAVCMIFVKALVVSTKTADLPGLVKSGDLTKILIQPWQFFRYFFVRDLPDKFFNFLFAALEVGILTSFFKLSLLTPQDWSIILLFVFAVLIAVFLNFVISLFLSVFVFWTEETWALRFLFGVIFLELFAGAFFPLDILPIEVQKIINLTPFPYLIFFPLKIWLGQLSTAMILNNILFSLIWLFFFWILVKKFWLKGLKNYGAYGH